MPATLAKHPTGPHPPTSSIKADVVFEPTSFDGAHSRTVRPAAAQYRLAQHPHPVIGGYRSGHDRIRDNGGRTCGRGRVGIDRSDSSWRRGDETGGVEVSHDASSPVAKRPVTRSVERRADDGLRREP